MGNISTLAIETSCDDTSIGIISYDNTVFAVEKLLAYSQVQDHQPYGGVVPELASRLHSEKIVKVLENIGYDTIKDVDFISVTVKPGLPGSLIVGRATAYMLAEYFNKPVKEINHIHGHIFSLFLERNKQDIKFPMVVLTASGGHNDLYLIEREKEGEKDPVAMNGAGEKGERNYLLDKPVDRLGQYTITKLGWSLDDAAGECFDKVSKMLGGPYPGGPRISQKAALGKINLKVTFPRIFLSSKEYNFSFSGMKSHVHYFLEELKKNGKELDEELINDIAYEFQESIVEVLGKKLIKAGIEFEARTLGITGGVSANDRLFSYVQELLEHKKEKEMALKDTILLRPLKKLYSTDNAAMIGLVGILEYNTNVGQIK